MSDKMTISEIQEAMDQGRTVDIAPDGTTTVLLRISVDQAVERHNVLLKLGDELSEAAQAVLELTDGRKPSPSRNTPEFGRVRAAIDAWNRRPQ